ncbi:fungal-specific transcription factor domain-containing protein [Mycena vulgaris]|nr:fungal-specific transcription factor domain-containing protein [Mycena vulgaris]
MSSEERDSPESATVPAKKRRIQRACDLCRQKRRACDGLRMSGRKCTYCIENGMECIYSGAVTTTKRKSYTDVLEARLALTENLLRKLSTETGRSPGTSGSSEWCKDSPIVQHAKSRAPALGPGVELAAMSLRALNEAEISPQEEDLAHLALVSDMQDLSVGHTSERFLGKSSGAMLIKAAADLKASASGPDSQFSAPWGLRRMEYWTSTPWMQTPEMRPRYTFPAPDVLSALVGLYFEHNNIYIPLLHRPTFERAVAEKLHLRDDTFGANVLLVCAVASRFSTDPRVFDASAPLTCGWPYYSQVSTSLDHMFVSPTLYDLQRYCLAIQFLEGSAPQANWVLIGVGIRLAQEAGAHRRQQGAQTVVSELWKRAFWVLVCYDRLVSTSVGRPCAIQYDDFDIDLPTECDDEYWEHEDPAQAFRQPPGTPSRVAFFNSFLRLNNILAFSLRILYSLNKAKDLLAVRDTHWEEHLVVEFDSALNKWIDSIPEHLRWDPHREDLTFFRQSVALYCGYYHVQMTTHRPFIPMLRQAAPTALPSLAICTNAARSCSHVADVSCRRMDGTPAIILLPSLTTAGVVLLLNVWSTKRTGLAPHMNTTITEVHKCMEAIRVCEERWQMAGLSWDILNELASVGSVPLPPHPPPARERVPNPNTNKNKRRASEADDGGRYTSVEEPVFAPWMSIDPMAGAGAGGAPFSWVGSAPALPMYTADLGRAPVYPPDPFQAYAMGSQVPLQPAWAETPNYGASSSTSVPFDPLGTAGTSAEDIMSMIDNDALAMWANAPMSLGAIEWRRYFSGMHGSDQ